MCFSFQREKNNSDVCYAGQWLFCQQRNLVIKKKTKREKMTKYRKCFLLITADPTWMQQRSEALYLVTVVTWYRNTQCSPFFQGSIAFLSQEVPRVP